MTFKPLKDRVVVKILERQDVKTESGVLVPEMAEHFEAAEVVASGNGDVAPQTGTPIPNETKPGDKVLIKKGAGIPVMVGNEWMRLVHEGQHVECIIE